jgi:LmbE family N-acetylglucosaminyl deacetylase
MSERAPLPEVVVTPQRGRVLVLAPHPDDDVIGCGGTALLHRRQGDPVSVVIGFDGAAGDLGGRHARDAYVLLREREARAAGAHLGLDDYTFLRWPEGHEPSPDDWRGAADRVADLIAERRPDVVYAPWVGEHHLDHHVLARVTRLALARSGFEGAAWGFEVWTPLVPTRVVDVTTVFDRKLAAIREHASQFEHVDLVHACAGMNAHRSIYVSRAARYAEAFRPLGPVAEEDRSLLDRRSAT